MNIDRIENIFEEEEIHHIIEEIEKEEKVDSLIEKYHIEDDIVIDENNLKHILEEDLDY